MKGPNLNKTKKEKTKVLQMPRSYRKSFADVWRVSFFGQINLGKHINQVVGWKGSPVPHYYVDP